MKCKECGTKKMEWICTFRLGFCYKGVATYKCTKCKHTQEKLVPSVWSKERCKKIRKFHEEV